ncbi:SDR family NAD(P)-dependent oxidoreductase [Hyphococcus formosus]|uniref:SDR family NAD(P)-dependent oxidoreductase n=1 Tax=Hyphococcus formosus TaxID=3143534 RepID=UPI00398B06C7
MSRALVIGGSGGIGSAVADVLRKNIADVHVISRREHGLDIRDERSIRDIAAILDNRGLRFNLIFVATGALEVCGTPPEKSFSVIKADAMAEAFAVNAIGPALLIKHFSALLAKDERAVFAFLSARVGSIEDNRLGGWMSYRASKAALNQLVKCASVEIKRSHPNAIITALHPGTIETPLTKKYARGRYTSTPHEGAEKMLSVLDKLTAEDTGTFLDYNGEEIPW